MSEVRSLALAFPEVEEKLTWDVHATFRVRDRIIAILSEDESEARIKATKEEQTAMLASDPEKFYMPSHVGRHGWIGVRLELVDSDELRELLEEAWRLTAPKKMVRAFDETAI